MSNRADVGSDTNWDNGGQEHDASCVLAVRDGDSAAFDRLVERYQRRAVAVSYRLLGSTHDAADVAQDAFLRAYRNLHRLEDPRRFGAWFMRIVTNLSLNFRRSRGRAAAFSTDDLVESGNERRASGAMHSDRHGAGANTDATELEQAVAAAVDALPEKQRLALVLFSMEGLPQKEVAEIMNCTVELVKWNVFQARKALRKALADYMDQD